MSIKATDPILGPSRGDPDAFYAVLVGPDAKDKEYVYAVDQWAKVAGVDSTIVYDQFCQETYEPSIEPPSPGTSVRWNRDLNPAGIGIPLDSTNQPVKIASGDEAARIHVQCLYSLCARDMPLRVPIPAAWQAWFQTVWLPKVCDANAPQVTTLADLNIRYVASDGESRATWAWDAAYTQGLLTCAARWLPNVPDFHVAASLVSYKQPYHLTARQGAVLRTLPSRDGRMIQILQAGQKFWVRGYTHGENVAGSDVWVQSAGAHGYFIHASGVDGSVPTA